MAKRKFNTNRLKRNYPLLCCLKKANNKKKQLILKNGNEDLLRCLCDICYNITKGNLSFKEKEKKKLMKHKKFIRLMANPAKNIKRKRILAQQTGGALSAVLIPAISLISSVIGGLLGK